jgi:uncharacterized membrane protein (DUF106 family)
MVKNLLVYSLVLSPIPLFALTGALAGGPTGQTAYQKAQPDQMTTKKLQEEREKLKKEQEEAKKNNQQAQLAIQP